MNARQLLDPLGNAIGAFCLFAGIAGFILAAHYTPDQADRERAADVARWLDEGCNTDTDCERMESEIGLDHLTR